MAQQGVSGQHSRVHLQLYVLFLVDGGVQQRVKSIHGHPMGLAHWGCSPLAIKVMTFEGGGANRLLA